MQFEKLSKKTCESGAIEVDIVVGAEDVDLLLEDFRLAASTCGDAKTASFHGAASDGLPDRLRELQRDFVINCTTAEALKTLGITPALTPKLHAVDYPEANSCFRFSLAVVERPNLALTSVEPVEVEMDEIVATEEYVEKRIGEFLEGFACYEDVEPRSVAAVDKVKVDIVTKIGEEIVPRLSGKEVILDLGDGSMPLSFVEGILGMEVGEKRSFSYEVEHPRAVSRDDVDCYQVDVEILSQQRKVDQVPTDDWIRQTFPRVSSAEEFFLELRKDIEYDVDVFNRDTRAHLANIELEKRLVGVISDEFYQASFKGQMDKHEKGLVAQGKTLEDYFEEEGSNEQELTMKMLVKSGESLRQGFALEALFDGRSMQLDAGEVLSAFEQLFGKGSYDEADLKRNGKISLAICAAKRSKALSWLVDTARVRTPRPKV